MRDDNAKKQLEEFSQTLIKLGKNIEAKLTEKMALEEMIKYKELQVRDLQKEIFEGQTRVAKISSDLAKLEMQRKGIEKNNPNFNSK